MRRIRKSRCRHLDDRSRRPPFRENRKPASSDMSAHTHRIQTSRSTHCMAPSTAGPGCAGPKRPRNIHRLRANPSCVSAACKGSEPPSTTPSVCVYPMCRNGCNRARRRRARTRAAQPARSFAGMPSAFSSTRSWTLIRCIKPVNFRSWSVFCSKICRACVCVCASGVLVYGGRGREPPSRAGRAGAQLYAEGKRLLSGFRKRLLGAIARFLTSWFARCLALGTRAEACLGGCAGGGLVGWCCGFCFKAAAPKINSSRTQPAAFFPCTTCGKSTATHS